MKTTLTLTGHTCAACGVTLEPYEVFAARVRGLKKPVCLGCALSAVLFMRDQLMPLLEGALDRFVPPNPRSNGAFTERTT